MMRILFVFLFAAVCPLLASEQRIELVPPYQKLLDDHGAATPALAALLSFFGISQDQGLDSIVPATQMRWLQTGKERWEFLPLEEDKKPQLVPLLQQIGLFDDLHAMETEYDYALVHGGFFSRVRQRINHLVAEYQRGIRFRQIIFLTGQRFLDPNTEEKDLPLQTETEMMLFVWENTPMPEALRQIPFSVIDAPRKRKPDGNWTRPSTQDTLIAWQNTSPKPGHCLFISSQPFCGYQDSIARTCLPSTFTVETVGLRSAIELPISVYLDNLARFLYQEKIRRS